LARRVGGAERPYLTLDAYEVLDQAMNAPDQLLARGDRLILDEVQRAPDLLLSIKRAVDEDRRPGRFLLTGSANLALMAKVSETLAGRAVYLTLGPMTRREQAGLGTAGSWDLLLDVEPDRWLESILDSTYGGPALDWRDLARRGGYPTPALELKSDDDRAAWFEGYQRTYLERDLQQLSSVDDLVAFRRLARAAALRVGGLQNQADLARDVGLAPSTAQRWMDLLEASYQLVRLESYSVNRIRRLVKSPKIFWNDTGLALHLAGAEPGGAHLENLVASELWAWRETRTRRPEILFWRTSRGAEVDFVIETPDRLVPIEVKTAPRVRVSDARHLELFMDEYPEAAPRGILLYGGDQVHPLTERVLAVPWSRMI
jgi:predicted AAA+ superfamily ATPase